MSLKNKDAKNRWRSKTVAFRMSPEEAEQLNTFAKLSGLSKQDYLIHRVLQKEIVVQGNPRVYKMLRNQLEEILTELKQMEEGIKDHDELFELILYVGSILEGLKGESE